MESEKYDIIIDINSIRFLQDKGWKIIYTNTEKENDLKDLLNSSKKSIVSILGHSNRGKTYILQRISGVKLEAGYQIQTKGLSIKIPEKKNILLLDTAGTNAPLLVEEGEEDRRHEKNFQKDLD
jgi:translation initiation factor 2 gamma subunit (eIF-2gamma)